MYGGCASYLQQMTALQDRARSRKAWRSSKESAYFSVCPSMMSASSFSLRSESPSAVQCSVRVALVAYNPTQEELHYYC